MTDVHQTSDEAPQKLAALAYEALKELDERLPFARCISLKEFIKLASSSLDPKGTYKEYQNLWIEAASRLKIEGRVRSQLDQRCHTLMKVLPHARSPRCERALLRAREFLKAVVEAGRIQSASLAA